MDHAPIQDARTEDGVNIAYIAAGVGPRWFTSRTRP